MATTLGARVPGVHGIHPSYMDLSVSPCLDFFQYANGVWLKDNPIPPDQGAWGGFNEVKERNRAILRSILEQAAAAGAPAGSPGQVVGDFYASGMDTRAIEQAGLAPLEPALARIEAIRNGHDLAAAIAQAHLEGAGPAFGFSVGPDDKRATATIAQFAQGGLGLPDRDCYTNQDDKSRELRAAYQAHVARMFGLMGDPPRLAKARAGIVLALETRLAGASMTRVQRRDPNAIYHRMTMAELAEAAPGFQWGAYCQTLGLGPERVLVRQPGFFRELSAMVREIPLPQWKTYLRWRTLSAVASCLGSRFEREHFAFYGTTLNGIRTLSERWKRVQDATDQALGDALGRLYVERAFGPGAKERALTLVATLRQALEARIRDLDWMTASTRAAALAKLEALTVKIGYPERWRDYAGLAVARSGYLANVVRARVFESRRDLAKLGHPVDRGEWEMTAPTVNAYYNPLMNEIVFPAGILQPPFFDPEADDAVNYGAIGMVIGHEMTHGFDDEGRQYDAQGNLKDWWTPEDTEAFAARTGLVERQFDALEALPGVKVNGKLTLGENIADLGGLRIAYAAFQQSLRGKARPAALDGFTAEQRFFLSFAQAWQFQAREEVVRLRAMVDPHAPPRFRVNGPLANLPEFSQAFGCGEGTAMNNPTAVRPVIW